MSELKMPTTTPELTLTEKPAPTRGPVATLTFQDLADANASRVKQWHGELGVYDWTADQWLTAVVGELGELASLLKMRNRESSGIDGNKFQPTQELAEEEIADVVIYLFLLAHRLGINVATAVMKKFNKTSEARGFPERLQLRTYVEAHPVDVRTTATPAAPATDSRQATRMEITGHELQAIDHLEQAWKAYRAAGVSDTRPGDEVVEFRHIIHAAQDLIAARVTRRAFPQIFK